MLTPILLDEDFDPTNVAGTTVPSNSITVVAGDPVIVNIRISSFSGTPPAITMPDSLGITWGSPVAAQVFGGGYTSTWQYVFEGRPAAGATGTVDMVVAAGSTVESFMWQITRVPGVGARRQVVAAVNEAVDPSVLDITLAALEGVGSGVIAVWARGNGDVTLDIMAPSATYSELNEFSSGSGSTPGGLITTYKLSGTTTPGVIASDPFIRMAGTAFEYSASGGDTTAPTLSAPTGTATGSSTATVGATTDEGNGTMYAVVTASATQPSVAQIKAGQDHTGAAAVWSGSQAISTTGAKTFSATGLAAATAYYAHVVHTDAATNDSNRVSSASFTTNAAPQLLRPTSTVSAGSWLPSTGGSIPAVLDETVFDDADFAYTSTTADVLVVGLAAGSDPAVSTGHIVRYRLRGDGTSGVQVELLQGTTQIATWTHDPAPSSFTSYEQTLSGGQADSITDYTALRLRFTEV